MRAGTKESLLRGTNETHRLTVVSVDVDVGIEIVTVEAHAPRVVDTVARCRPVAAVETDKVDRSTIPAARSRQKHGSVLFQSVPLRSSDRIASEACPGLVDVAQRIVVGTPIVRKQDHSVDAVHIGLNVADARIGAPCIEQVCPFLVGQRTPTIVLLVATVANSVAAPVGLTRLVEQMVTVIAVDVVIAA